MKYTADGDYEWGSETIRFADGKGLLVPGIEDNIVYARASDENNKSWVMELQRTFPDRNDAEKPSFIRDSLVFYLQERLHHAEHDIAYHIYALGNPGVYWKAESWYHSFDFDINGDTILIVRSRGFLEAYINNKKIKYSDYEGSVTGVSGIRFQLEDLYKYLDKKYFANDYNLESNSYMKYIELLAKTYLNGENTRDFNIVKQEAMTDKKKKANEDWEADTDPMKDFRRPRRENKEDFSISKLFESILRESAGGLSEEDKDEVLKAFRKNNIKIIETSEEYESGMYCFEVIAGNSNPTMIGYLHDDLYALESRGICFDEAENEEGFYGRTFIFYYLDDNE